MTNVRIGRAGGCSVTPNSLARPQLQRQMRDVAVGKMVSEIAMRVSSVIEDVGDEASGNPNKTAEAEPSAYRESGVDEITGHPYSSTQSKDWAGQLWGDAVQPNHAVERRVEIMRLAFQVRRRVVLSSRLAQLPRCAVLAP